MQDLLAKWTAAIAEGDGLYMTEEGWVLTDSVVQTAHVCTCCERLMAAELSISELRLINHLS